MSQSVVKTKFFEFSQNNSGGLFDIDDERGIGPKVWIEAVDTEHANSRAVGLGIYFDGVEDGSDCECCGDRWHPAYGDGSATPDINAEYDFNWHNTVYVHGIDGAVKRIAKATGEA